MKCVSKTDWVNGWKFCVNCNCTWPKSYEGTPNCSASQPDVKPVEIDVQPVVEPEVNLAVEEQMANDKLSHWKDTK